MTRLVRLLFLAILLLVSPVANAYKNGVPSAFNGHKVQLNVPSASDQFLNLFKAAGRWTNISAGGSFDITRLDANGYPTSLPTGGAQVNIGVPASTSLASYILLWDGAGTLTTSGTLLSGSYSTSGCVVSFGGSTPATVQVGITAVNSPSDYPHNIRMVANNGRDPALLAAGNVYRPEYIAYIQSAGILRFMDAGDGNSNTSVFWADRKPTTYYTFNSYYFPPGKIVPIANVSYDGISAYTVTWSGQTGPLTDKTQMLLQLPNAQTAFPSTINLNATGAFPIASTNGTVRVSGGVPASIWVQATYDLDLGVWMIDNSSGTQNIGIDNGMPPEMMILQANLAGAHAWFTPGMYQCDYGTNSISDYVSNLATLANNTLFPGLQYIQEAGPNELWNNSFAQTTYAYNKQLFKNGGSPYAVTDATSGATTTLTIGTNTTQVGSLLNVQSVGGLSGASGNARVLSKPSGTTITVNLASTGTYTNGGTATPQTFDSNNWYGIVASNIAQAVAAAIPGGKGTRYRVIAGFQMFGGASGLTTNTGTNTRIQSPFLTTGGGSAAYNWLAGIAAATYFQPGYEASTSQMTIIEGQLAFEYPGATTLRQTAILDQYSNSTTDSFSPVNISNITPGNPTVVTVDSTVRFVVSDIINGSHEVSTLSGVTGNIGVVLNGSSYNSPNFQVLSKTATTITINVDTTGRVYSGGGTMTTKGSVNVNITNVYANIAPAFLLYTSTYNLEFMAYEGGQGPDRMASSPGNNDGGDSWATIKGITNGATTVINVGANSWDYLYNTLGQSGLTTHILSIGSGTLGTLLNGHTYTILSATPTTITINVDTSAVSSWVSGGTASYVGSMNAVNTLRNMVNFTPAAQTNTVTNYTSFAAVGAAFKYPSEFTLVGLPNYSMLFPDLLGQTLTPYRYNGMISY